MRAEKQSRGLINNFNSQNSQIKNIRNFVSAYGTVISYSSFNPRKNNCQKDAIFVATANYFVSIIATMTVFGIVGFKALTNTDRCLLNKLNDHELSTRLLPQLDGISTINEESIEAVTDLIESRSYEGELAGFAECSQVIKYL